MARSAHGPMVNDPDQYEALRDQGMSKEKAARDLERVIQPRTLSRRSTRRPRSRLRRTNQGGVAPTSTGSGSRRSLEDEQGRAHPRAEERLTERRHDQRHGSGTRADPKAPR